MYWAALLAGTWEYSEWIGGGRIRVTQTQKREYANIMVVCMCSVGEFSQRSTGTMSVKALPSQSHRHHGSTSLFLISTHSNPGPNQKNTSRRAHIVILTPSTITSQIKIKQD